MELFDSAFSVPVMEKETRITAVVLGFSIVTDTIDGVKRNLHLYLVRDEKDKKIHYIGVTPESSFAQLRKDDKITVAYSRNIFYYFVWSCRKIEEYHELVEFTKLS